jgi:hypothetical protein
MIAMSKVIPLLALVMFFALALGASVAQEETGSLTSDVSPLELHDAYWVSKIDLEGLSIPLTVINDMHVEASANSVTVYAQSRVKNLVVTPPQVGPGECTETPAGETVCFHPNAVYLNGSGEELMEADDAGEWWVKHAWILGGEGYLNCELASLEAYNECMWVEGKLLDDGLTMKIGGIEQGSGFNLRKPLHNEDPIAYQVTRYRPANSDAEGDETDLTPTAHVVLTFECIEEVSAFDHQARSCPGSAEGPAGSAQSPAPSTSGSQNPKSIPTSKEAGLDIQTVPSVTRTQYVKPPDDIRDYRYCEVMLFFLIRQTLKTEFYTTISHNNCPADLWAGLDADAMAADYGAEGVLLNGPRYWVLNKIAGKGNTAAGKTADFGGIEMKKLAAINETKLREGSGSGKRYQEIEVQRSTTWTYSAGNMVYELISPAGDVYRMQSYSQIVDPALTIADLETLGERLDLPEGWRYETRLLTEESELTADGLAYVIQDELSNTYQKVID